jgi:hypothetical protein
MNWGFKSNGKSVNWSAAFTNKLPEGSKNPDSLADPEHKRKFTEKNSDTRVAAASKKPYLSIAQRWFGKPTRSIEDPDVLFRISENNEIFIGELGTRFRSSIYSIFELKDDPNEIKLLKKAPLIGTPVSDIIFNEDIRTSEKNIYIAAVSRINEQDYGHAYIIIVTKNYNFYTFGTDNTTKVRIRSPDGTPVTNIIDIGILTEDMKERILNLYSESMVFDRFNIRGYNCAAILSQIIPHINCSPFFGTYVNTPTLCQPLPPNPPNYINQVLQMLINSTEKPLHDDEGKALLFNEIVQYIGDVKTRLGHNGGRKTYKKRKSCKKKRRKTYKKRKSCKKRRRQ